MAKTVKSLAFGKNKVRAGYLHRKHRKNRPKKSRRSIMIEQIKLREKHDL